MKEEDILARQSRPQRHSTWVPKTRDWRYATGVFKHHDFEDAPKDRSAWDTLDYDHQVDGKVSTARSRSGSETGDGSEVGLDDLWDSNTPECSVSTILPESSSTIVRVERMSKKNTPKRNLWKSVARYRWNGDVAGDRDAGYQAFSLIVRLQFSARTAKMLNATHTSDTIELVHTFLPFQRTWVDETQDFNMRTVRATLRQPGTTAKDLGNNYGWYTDAVPADALFPPGVPLSAKEMIAYYPHHVRWKGVMLRLTNNDYRGRDIMGMQTFFRGPPKHNIPAAQMNTFQRDTVKRLLPDFKTDILKGKHDRKLHTAHLTPGRYVQDQRTGFTVPTFDNLLCGLKHLPSGLDARGLTECLVWYLSFRDSFTPKLDLNVLHTQALIRALRLPLKPFGPQNLDCNALKEWKEKGRFEERKVGYESKNPTATTEKIEQHGRTRLHMNLDNHEVKLDVTLPLRHILTFPFLALHNVLGSALKLGIEKAENRKAERQSAELSPEGEQVATGETTEAEKEKTREKKEKEKEKEPYRIPKRPLTAQDMQSLAPASRKYIAQPGSEMSEPTGPCTTTWSHQQPARERGSDAAACWRREYDSRRPSDPFQQNGRGSGYHQDNGWYGYGYANRR
ncbi:hypothetical protein BDW02DRAFT_261599 [Decorospora gaudefroyi]|uniref:Uncharacterized protein n=1 Tax=Decorospora gaudefroyi TaxID=184978 RepID=A0A6A5KNF6_9PLEO|nr:hypothetical protein BDW02DRAFT_261599 [Decorospora gaudefroyi]